MECAFAVLVLVGTAVLVVWLRVSSRLKKTERRIVDLELEVARLRAGTEPGPEVTTEQGPEPSARAMPPQPAEVEPTLVEVVQPASPVPRPDVGEPEPAAPAPPPAPPPPFAVAEPAAPRMSAFEIDWEQWVGVRGAAVAGGVVLALAALLFFKYTIEHGLIPPIVRVIAGVVAGMAAIWGSEVLRKRGYEPVANALAGAGVVGLYASFWAANRLYGFIPTVPSYVLMILVTVACGVLSWRHRSLVIAILGLAGGFVTPLLLSSGSDNPIGLFGYLLLLDTGLLTLARRRGWPVLGILGLAATAFYQAGWIFRRMDSDRVVLGLLILGVFAVLFAFVGARAQRDAKPREVGYWRASLIAGILLPFLFTLYFAGNADLGKHLWAVAGLLFMLSLAAEWIARDQSQRLIGVAAAAADLAVVLTWCGRTRFEDATAWEAAAISLALSSAFALFVWLDFRRTTVPADLVRQSLAARVAVVGFLVLLVVVSLGSVPSLWPWLVGWIVLSAVLVLLSRLPALGYLAAVAGGLLGTGLAFFFAAHARAPALPSRPLYFALVVATAAGFQLDALWRRDPSAKRWSEGAAALLPFIMLVILVGESVRPSLHPGLYYLVSITLAVLVALVGTRLEDGRILLVTMAVLAVQHLIWSIGYSVIDHGPGTVLMAMAAQLSAILFFVGWPFVTMARFDRDRWAWYAAALAPAAWFLSLKELFEIRFGETAIGLLPALLGAIALGAAYQSRGLWAAGDARRRSNLAWFAAVALGMLSVAIPLQLDKEWITIGWALEGVAVVALWRGLDHPGLKYFGLLLLGAVTVRLVANPAVLGYYPRSGWPVLNWLMYTYLVPAAALLGAAWILEKLERERALEWEDALYSKGWPITAIGCGMAAIAVVFVWINLTVFDAFSRGPSLTISFERLPARDLTLSLAWAAYALILLAVGMARRSQGLRWISLAFLVLTIGKVFLHDLGELRDLYRVASLLGLAFSLILVSLAYQRFVFGRREEAEE